MFYLKQIKYSTNALDTTTLIVGLVAMRAVSYLRS